MMWFPGAFYPRSRGWGLANLCNPPPLPQLTGSEEGVWPRPAVKSQDFCWECISLLHVSTRHAVLGSAAFTRATRPRVKLIPKKVMQRHWENRCSQWPCYLGSYVRLFVSTRLSWAYKFWLVTETTEQDKWFSWAASSALSWLLNVFSTFRHGVNATSIYSLDPANLSIPHKPSWEVSSTPYWV